MTIAYRREIDGLRAIAVLAVVAYHASRMGAGYVGVDVFFVISGYLITSLLLREHEQTGSLDLVAFYARRVRRIFPAAFVLVLAVVALGWLLLGQLPLLHLCRSAAASALFVANVFFQHDSEGYFSMSAEEMPLLHLWSLAVEEQFYLVWPALVLLVLKWRRSWLPGVLVLLGAVSLVGAEVLLRGNPSAAFYQMPPRFWELAAGGIIATTTPRGLPAWLAWFGVALVLAACALPMPHVPALGVLPAVLGAVAVIAHAHGGGSNRLLASRPFVGVGLVSYSLYLWHWPLLALYRATSIGEGSMLARTGLCVVALVFAVASYRYVEQPLRRLRGPSARFVLIGAFASIGLAALMWWLSEHARAGENPEALRSLVDKPPHTCYEEGIDPIAFHCTPVPGTRVAVWGDSMAYSWQPMVRELDPRAAVFSRAGCGPFVDFRADTPWQRDRDCTRFNALAPAKLRGLDVVYLVARWRMYPERTASLARTLAVLAPQVRHVVVIGPTPDMREWVARCYERNDIGACAISRADFDAVASPMLRQLRALAAPYPNVRVLDPTPFFCNATTCPAERKGHALYFDSRHVTASAARDFAREGFAGE